MKGVGAGDQGEKDRRARLSRLEVERLKALLRMQCNGYTGKPPRADGSYGHHWALHGPGTDVTRQYHASCLKVHFTERENQEKNSCVVQSLRVLLRKMLMVYY